MVSRWKELFNAHLAIDFTAPLRDVRRFDVPACINRRRGDAVNAEWPRNIYRTRWGQRSKRRLESPKDRMFASWMPLSSRLLLSASRQFPITAAYASAAVVEEKKAAVSESGGSAELHRVHDPARLQPLIHSRAGLIPVFPFVKPCATRFERPNDDFTRCDPRPAPCLSLFVGPVSRRRGGYCRLGNSRTRANPQPAGVFIRRRGHVYNYGRPIVVSCCPR